MQILERICSQIIYFHFIPTFPFLPHDQEATFCSQWSKIRLPSQKSKANHFPPFMPCQNLSESGYF